MDFSDPESLLEEHDLSAFDCGKPALNDWLKRRALFNHKNGFTAVMVVHVAQRVVGYYGLAPTSISPALLPRFIRTGQPPDPVPCLLLGQLATDRQWAGRGVGAGLLQHALRRCVRVAALVGGRALLVRAIDEDARTFWLAHDFTVSKDDENILFRPLARIAASLDPNL